MADEVDIMSEMNELINQSHINIALKDARSIPAGAPGVCIECGEQKKRLVRKRCAPCRDDLNLP